MRKVLIVVDMLNDFCSAKGVLATSPVTNDMYAKPIINAVKAIVDKFRNEERFIIWLADAHAEDDKEFDRFPKHAVKGTWGSKIISELKPDWIDHSGLEKLLEKTRYSGFYGTKLGDLLKFAQPDEVTVVGVCTSICCLMTATGLVNRDYKVIVPKNAVADFDPDAHSFTLKYMESILGVKIV
jgi:nicotinamidase-related amidase